ncbi:multiple sugar transport system permease protein [Motilibacter peucedani]|uniref:Multiple sugar transport system permease protein n=1 Tax=Motilibacter peucedani TaxID=598650 RepID=A0A420XLP1_9ACTN|nr:sugar ABC transporter permease [Motilibacter peucedani]RKS71444.1 multiple sugar transport system permease protein [Motilibacter peucedani]
MSQLLPTEPPAAEAPVGASPAAGRTHRYVPWRSSAENQPIGTLFALPYLAFVAVVFAFPLGFAVWISLHDYFFAAPGASVDRPWVGLDNYKTALQDPAVRSAFGHVLVFLVINVPLTVVLSLVLAASLNAAIPFRTAFRTSFYLPYVTASIAIVGVWLFLFSEDGIVNKVLGPLAPDPSWLTNSHLAMPSIALFVTWKQLGFFILLYLAALQNVPKDLYEAAAVDGASKLRMFRSITIPSVRPATTLVVVLSTITGGNLFTEPYLLTGGGGPNGSSTSPVLLMYQRGIEQSKPDVAAAIGVLLVLLVMLIAGVQRLVLERK